MDKTIRQIAEELELTVDAIHKQRKRHSDIQEHCKKNGRVWYIDDIGQELIRAYTTSRAEALVDIDKDAQIQQLQQEKIDLLVRIAQLEHERAEHAALIAQSKAETLLLETANNQIDELKNEIDNLKTENNKYKPTIFGLYRKTN